jgi:hypothetical protein
MVRIEDRERRMGNAGRDRYHERMGVSQVRRKPGSNSPHLLRLDSQYDHFGALDCTRIVGGGRDGKIPD